MSLPISVWIILLAAIALLVAAVGRATRSWGIIVALLLWGGAVAAVVGSGVVPDAAQARFPMIGLLFLVPVVGLVVAYRRSPRLRAVLAAADLPWLLRANAMRVLGVEFLVVAGLGLLPWHFALPAGLGDIAAGIAAPFVARAAARRGAGARASIILFSVYGLFDLVVAVGTGVLSSSGLQVISVAGQPSTDAMGFLPLALVPAYAVPILLLLHIGVLARVYQPAWRGSSSPAPSAST